jgi:hypothetical protein
MIRLRERVRGFNEMPHRQCVLGLLLPNRVTLRAEHRHFRDHANLIGVVDGG